MALFLVARFFGQEEAMRIARVYLLDRHSRGQLPFAALAGTRPAADAAIADAQVWLADNYAELHVVSAMSQRSGLSERSFKRRFSKATGMAPIDYVHTLRLEQAKQLLETTDDPVESIANDVGYEDASFFRRLFGARSVRLPRSTGGSSVRCASLLPELGVPLEGMSSRSGIRRPVRSTRCCRSQA